MRPPKGSTRFSPASARALSDPAGAGWPFAASEFVAKPYTVWREDPAFGSYRADTEADTEAKRRTHGPHGPQRSAPREHPGGATRGRAAPGGAEAEAPLPRLGQKLQSSWD